MPKVSPIQTSFSTGEISPLLYGRVDIDKYKKALKTSLNGLPLVQGPWTRRPGSHFAAECKNHGEACYLYPFEFSVTQAYVLVFGPSYIRFLRNNALITLTAQNITGITKTNPAVVTYSGSDTYANGDRVVLAGVGGMSQVNNREFTVANVDTGANTFELSGVDSSAYDAYTSGGTVAEIYEIASPYAEADLFTLKFTQSADTLYITHPSYAPRTLTRSAHTSWTLSSIAFSDGPYLAENATATTLTPGAATGSGVSLVASADTFAATDVGRSIRIKEGSTWGWARIATFTDAKNVTLDIQSTLTNTNAKTVWRLGLFSDTTGYPAAVTFFEDRLFFGGVTNYPQRVDGSCSGNYTNMAPSALDGTVADDNAVAFTLSSNDVNVIRWMADDEKGLLIGTVAGEWIMRPSVNAEALSPTNITAKQSTTYGSANLPAVKAGKAALFVQRSQRKVREIAYLVEVDGFRAPDMTVLAEHMTRGGIHDLSYQKEPQSILWAVRNDGTLLSFTYEREQDVLGWGRHVIGGVFGSGSAVVESVAVIPASDGTRDELYVVVKRTINGGTKRYIEYMGRLWDETQDQEDAVFLDSALTYDSTATTTVSGLWHLEGQTVTVWADGATHPTKVVTNGKVTLDRASSVVQIGLDYNSDGQMLRLEAGAADGTAQGKLQRAHRVIIRLWQTLGLKLGYELSDTTMYQPVLRKAGDPAGQAVPLFDGDIEEPWEGGNTTENYICWRINGGAPGTVEAVMPQMYTQDR